MILRLLIAAMIVLVATQFYFQDSNTADLKPKQQIENVESDIYKANKKAEDNQKKALENMGI